MTLVIKRPVTSGFVLRQTWRPMDPDAATYIAAVEAADGQALEEKTKIAIDNFVLGCKTDGIWTAIKASCILAGARTLGGALVPLVGAAPTNFNFAAGDYNRKTGLAGNGSTKYLDSNRAQQDDPQNNCHLSTYVSSAHTTVTTAMYVGGDVFDIYRNAADLNIRNRANSPAAVITGGGTLTGFMGSTRIVSSSFLARANASTVTANALSAVGATTNIFVFRRSTGTALYSNARLAFYSIGESLDLALLDARVTTLINALAIAIP